jgi:protein tyrosine/serine phosphatase
MLRILRVVFALVIVGVLVGGPLVYLNCFKTRYRNFHVVQEGVLYRSGQLSLDGLKRLIHDYGIKTVITLRYAAHPGEEPPDRLEEQYVVAEGYNYFRIPHLPWSEINGEVPAEKNVELFRRIMSDPSNQPVLIHCYAGIHRTGAFCAIYRMEFQHWPREQAVEEMRACGYREIDDHFDVMSYLRNFRAKGAGDAVPSTIRPASHSSAPAQPSFSPPLKY